MSRVWLDGWKSNNHVLVSRFGFLGDNHRGLRRKRKRNWEKQASHVRRVFQPFLLSKCSSRNLFLSISVTTQHWKILAHAIDSSSRWWFDCRWAEIFFVNRVDAKLANLPADIKFLAKPVCLSQTTHKLTTKPVLMHDNSALLDETPLW